VRGRPREISASFSTCFRVPATLFQRKPLYFICFDARIACPSRIARAIATDRRSRQHRSLLRCQVLRAMPESAGDGHHSQFYENLRLLVGTSLDGPMELCRACIEPLQI
jgi:hypothetical protein